jgi:hypothetical protein
MNVFWKLLLYWSMWIGAFGVPPEYRNAKRVGSACECLNPALIKSFHRSKHGLPHELV